MTTTVASIFETMEWGPAPEASGPALDWIRARNGTLGLFIGGQWVPAGSGGAFEPINPGARGGRPRARRDPRAQRPAGTVHRRPVGASGVRGDVRNDQSGDARRPGAR